MGCFELNGLEQAERVNDTSSVSDELTYFISPQNFRRGIESEK